MKQRQQGTAFEFMHILGKSRNLKLSSACCGVLIFQPVQCCSPAAGLKGIPNSLLVPVCDPLTTPHDLLLGKKLNTGGLTTDQLLTLG